MPFFVLTLVNNGKLSPPNLLKYNESAKLFFSFSDILSVFVKIILKNP